MRLSESDKRQLRILSSGLNAKLLGTEHPGRGILATDSGVIIAFDKVSAGDQKSKSEIGGGGCPPAVPDRTPVQ